MTISLDLDLAAFRMRAQATEAEQTDDQLTKEISGLMTKGIKKTFAGDSYEGVEVAAVAVVRFDGEPSVFLAKRAYDETDDPEVQETWEFVGGHLQEDEEPLAGAAREFAEEIGFELPEGEVINGWRSEDGVYQGFVYEALGFPATNDWTPTEEVQAIGWFTREEVEALAEEGTLRPEVRDQTDWDMIFAVPSDEEDSADSEEDVYVNEDDEDEDFAVASAIPIHGVLAPEETESGDKRGFADGSVTSRPMPITFRWQKQDIGGHDGAIVVGAVDRLMRKDGLIHFEGRLMPSNDTEDFLEVLEFFSRFGVSVDGDRGELAAERSETSGVTWYEAVRAAGLTAVAIPAYAEAYVALGTHPEFPEEDSEEYAVLVASMDLATFKRGPGWVTNPKETSRLHRYWTQRGQPGYNKVRWGTPGDWRRARVLIGEKIAKNSPEKMRYLNQIISQWHFDALGYWPGELGKPGNPPDTKENRRRAARHASSGESVTFREVSTEERKRLAESGAAMPDGSYPIANCSDLQNAIQAIGRAKDPEAVKRHIRKRKSALGCEDIDLPDTWAVKTSSAGSKWTAVLTASGQRVLPPIDYFNRHPDTGATVVEEPDENGIRRTYGYAAEWGVCHIGMSGECVEPPEDMTGDYADFHRGVTKISEGGFLPTGLITYKRSHRSAEELLTSSAEQDHFDNIGNAWAAVRLGEDERGIWFSGVVLPHVPEEDLTLIEAAGQVSGEWVYGSLRTLLSVNVPGYPVERSSAVYDDEGRVLALAASAFSGNAELNGVEASPCAQEDDPVGELALEIMDRIDARERMVALRWAYTKEKFNGLR